MSDSLLESSIIFRDATLIDKIRQSYINLNEKTDQEVVQELVNEIIKYLEKDITKNIANELFSLILKCFSCFPDLLLPIFNTILDKSRLNSNFIIATVSVLSYLINKKPELKLPDYNSFVNDAINEIRPQIQESEISIFGHKIHPQFKYNLIINFLLCSDFTMTIISDFLPYVFSPEHISKIPSLSTFIEISSKRNLLSLFPDSILKNRDILFKLTNEDLAYFIPIISDQIFIQNQSMFETIIQLSGNLNSLYCVNVIQKCSKLNIKLDISLVIKILFTLKSSEINPQICEYLNQYKFLVSSTKSKELLESPYCLMLFDKLSSISLFTDEQLIQILKQKTDIKTNDASSSQFYIDIYSYFNKNDYTKKLIGVIKYFIQKYVGKEKFIQIIDEMIFSVYPPTVKGVCFLNMFLQKIDNDYKELFQSKEHMTSFLSKVLEKKVTPVIEFSEIIDYQTKLEMLQQTGYNQNSLLIYLCCCSPPNEPSITITEITVLPQTNQSIEQCINRSDKTQLSDESLSFVFCALFLVKSKNKINIKGLTNEVILQFYSIAAEFFEIKSDKKDDVFLDTISSPELISLLIEGFKLVSNNQSSSVISSVNKLLKSFNLCFSEKLREEIVTILTPFLLNGEYFADKSTLLLAILNNNKFVQIDNIIEYIFGHCSEIDFKSFHYSNNKLEFNQEKASQLVIDRIQNPSLSTQEIINVIYIIKNVFNFELKLNFESTQNLIKIFNEVINENKSDESLLITEFMIKNGMTNEMHENINTKHNSSLLSMIPYNELNEDELISVFMSDSKPEKNNSLIEAIFNMMMKEKPNRIGYLISYYEKIKSNAVVKPILLLNLYNDKYEKYKDESIEALDHIFELHPMYNILLIRAEFKPFELPDLELNQKVVTRLLELTKERPNDYRPFFCLKCIASSFPFIFLSNIQEIIDYVLPKLNDFHILFDPKPENETKEQEEERINKFKTSFSAFSFLYSTLNTTKIIEYVTLWYIKHYKELTKSQMFCFNITFSVLIPSFPLPMVLLLYKHNFAEIFQYFMQIEIDNDEYSIQFNQNFNYSYYLMINAFYTILFEKLEKVAYLSSKIDSIENVFDLFLDKHLSNLLAQNIIVSNPGIFNVPNEIKKQNKEMLDFIIDVEDKKPFYLFENKNNRKTFNISDQAVNSFINNYKRIIPSPVPDETPLHSFAFQMNDEIIAYFLMKPKWLQDFLFYNITFPTLSDHRRMLIDSMNGIQELMHPRGPPIDLHSFSRNHIYNENFLKAVIEKVISLNNQPIDFLYALIQSMSTSSTNVKGFISIISNQLDEIANSEDNWSVDSINDLILLTTALINIVRKEIKCTPRPSMIGEFASNFFKEIGNKLIDMFLQPKYRDTKQLMVNIYELLNMIPFNLPDRSTHLIGFMLLSKSESTMIDAISFCSKFKVSELDHLEIIQDVFDQEIENENPRFNIIKAFMKSFPSVGNARVLEMFNMVTSFISKYKLNLKEIRNQKLNTNIDGFEFQNSLDYIILKTDVSDETWISLSGCPELHENEKLEENIITLLDFIAPKRDVNNSFTMSDSTTAVEQQQQQQQQNPNYKFYPIPCHIYDTMPQFWKFFDENRQIIDLILLKKFQKNKIPDLYDITQQIIPRTPLFTSKLVTMYPECFSFEFRSIYFRQKMLQSIQTDRVIQLNIDPNRIFSSSFEQLIRLTPMKWFCLFNVKYTDNIGYDAGGLTKDWLTKLSQTIFNPESTLFECLENNENYIIKQIPNEPSNSLLMAYRFAGMIVARALIQGELINAHLTRSFLKLILHHNINLNDVEDADEILFNSLKDIKDNKINEDPNYDLYFDVTTVGGQIFELVPNGSQIKVTDENKLDYIRLIAEYRLKKSIEKQVNAFCSGFDDLISHKNIRIFTPNELCLLICGVADIDVEDLKRNVQIQQPYNMDTPVVKMFFEVISEWDKQNLTKLLMFITGSSRMPRSGFKFFVDIKRPITIARDSDPSHCPVAHTCINRIDIPEYADKEDLNKKLLISIDENSFNLK